MQVDGSTLSNNTASVSGGCIWANITGCMLIQGSRVQNCSANMAGGGIWLDTGGGNASHSACSLLLTGAVLAGLSPAAQAASNSSSYSLWIAGSSSLSGNSAGMGGGALIQMSGRAAVLVDSLTASGNSASGSGGAMAVLSAE
jgi:hypothetical protein